MVESEVIINLSKSDEGEIFGECFCRRCKAWVRSNGKAHVDVPDNNLARIVHCKLDAPEGRVMWGNWLGLFGCSQFIDKDQ